MTADARPGVLDRLVGGWPARIGLVLALGLSGFYWALPSRVYEARRVGGLFYRPLLHQGLSLDGSYIPEHLESGNFSEWTHLLGRGALIRWHVRDVAPHALPALELRWQGGLWTPPDGEALRGALEGLDASWAARRRAAGAAPEWTFGELQEAGWGIAVLSGSDPVAHRLGAAGELIVEDAPAGTTVRLAPPEGLATDQLGDRLLVLADAASAEGGRLYRAVLYYHVNHLPESGLRRRVTEFAASADPAVVPLEFVLRDEPVWRVEGARLRSLRMDFPHAGGRLVLRGLRGGDAGEGNGGLAAGEP